MPTERVPDEGTALEPDRVHQRDDVCGHRFDGQIARDVAIGAAGATVIIGDDAVPFAQRREIGLPVAARAAETARQQDYRAARLAVRLPVNSVRVGHQARWAMLAISTRQSGFTSSVLMQ